MRKTAVLILDLIEKDGAYSDKALKQVLSKECFDSRDNALITEMVYGVISNKSRIDYIIGKFVKKKPNITVLNILRIGIYQILFLDKIPDNSAVDECVKIAKAVKGKETGGFVNGVLRSFIREGEPEYPNGREYFEIYYSHPKWLVNMLFKQYGDLAEKIIISNNEKAKTTVRVNRLKITPHELIEKLKEKSIEAYKTSEENIIEINKFGNIAKTEEYINGLFTPQDLSAYKAVLALDPKENETIIDVCSAPGGKTTAIAEMMNNNGKIHAFDIHPHKIDLINNNAKRIGANIIFAEERDSSIYYEEFFEKADRVLADVPCSGLGIIRKKPDIKWQDAFSKLDELMIVQRKILENAGKYVKKGGILVYSTCTINKKENSKTIEEFLSKYDFDKIYEKTYLPHIDNSDGFYICTLKKRM